MKYIKHFNKSIEGLFRLMPSDTTLVTIEKYKQKWNCPDYYQTLDKLGLKVGVEYFVQQVYDEDKGEVVSFVPSIKLHEKNPLTREFKIIEFSEFKSVNKAYYYIAKELVYRLMTIRDLDNFIASR